MFGVVTGTSIGLKCISVFFKSLCETSSRLPYICLVAIRSALFVPGLGFWHKQFLECVVSAQCNSYVCLLENVCNKSGLFAEVCEGSPFMCGFTWFLAGGYSRLPWGGVCVCVTGTHCLA